MVERIGTPKKQSWFALRKQLFCDRVIGKLFYLVDRCMSGDYADAMANMYEKKEEMEAVGEQFTEVQPIIEEGIEKLHKELDTVKEQRHVLYLGIERLHTHFVNGDEEKMAQVFSDLGFTTHIKGE